MYPRILKELAKELANPLHRLFKKAMDDGKLPDTVGQEIFADMIFSRISRILTKPRKCHVRKYDFNDLFTRESIVNCQIEGPNPRKYHVREMEFLAIRENFLSYSTYYSFC